MTLAPRLAHAADPQLDRRRLIIGAGLLGVATTAAAATPRRHEQALGDHKLADVIPDRLPGWAAQPDYGLVLPEATQPGSAYDQVLGRAFTQPGLGDVMMLIAYGSAQSGLMKVHRPEVCYTTAGFGVGPLRFAPLVLPNRRVITASIFGAKRDTRYEQVMYWTRVASSFPVSMNAERLATFRSGLRGVVPDGVLVRISSPTRDADVGLRTLSAFAEALVNGVTGAGRRLLVGAA